MEKAMRIAIVGGGATGVLTAAHLARRFDPAHDEIVVIEPGEALGRGLAYATADPRHLLNVRAANMSAFADQPEHLTAWLSARRGAGEANPFSFISRGLYGDYLAELAERTLANGSVRRVRARCCDVEEQAEGVRLTLSTGEALAADVAILATGHDAKPTLGGLPAEPPWSAGALEGLPPEGPILIVGSGLTMVDMALSLKRRGQRGPIVVLSRRGLLSTSHRAAPPRSLDVGEIPFGAKLSALLAWLRRLAARFAAEGAGWRSAVDSLRPHTQRLWGAMSLEQRRRFLRHARSYWDVHRHRMAPESEAALSALAASGQLTIVAGRVVAAWRVGEGVEVEILLRGAAATTTRRFARIIDCTGLCEQPLQSANPLLQALLARGAARPDALGIGFDVAPDLGLVGADGTASRRIKAIGPLARAAFWECIAIPDIRLQCAALAEELFLARKLSVPARGLASTAGR
jgi:uncharacterized NAD(P)/FAD-binding protein YdhS